MTTIQRQNLKNIFETERNKFFALLVLLIFIIANAPYLRLLLNKRGSYQVPSNIEEYLVEVKFYILLAAIFIICLLSMNRIWLDKIQKKHKKIKAKIISIHVSKDFFGQRYLIVNFKSMNSKVQHVKADIEFKPLISEGEEYELVITYYSKNLLDLYWSK